MQSTPSTGVNVVGSATQAQAQALQGFALQQLGQAAWDLLGHSACAKHRPAVFSAPVSIDILIGWNQQERKYKDFVESHWYEQALFIKQVWNEGHCGRMREWFRTCLPSHSHLASKHLVTSDIL